MQTFLFPAFVFLAASIISVPIAKRLGLGAVLGYLIAGALIGPFGLNLLGAPESVMHVAEFGVVIMLFLIGLELQPALLWRLRGAILGLGGAQVIVTGLALAGAGVAAGLDWRIALAAGFTLALSSTAIVLQSLREKGLSDTDPGRAIFSVLLFQDVAVIPMLALFPLLATLPPVGGHEQAAIDALPAWARPVAVLAAVGVVVLAGRFLARPLFRIIARADVREIFTATALALVVGVALLMQSVGLSPALGAFVAGVVLADSEFRHEIEADIEPFRALLLGLFFISIGAVINFALVIAAPLKIAAIVVGLILIKAIVLYLTVRLRRAKPDALLISFALAPGGEFAFVLFTFALNAGVIGAQLAGELVAAVALSMALTPLLILAGERLSTRLARPVETAIPSPYAIDRPEVIIAGFGRFGQVVNRLLRANGFSTSILEHNAEQVETVRNFGMKANYGDASRVDLLRAAGANDAKLLVIAVDDQDKIVDIVESAQKHFPHLAIMARAYDRAHAFELIKRGVETFERETFEGALKLGAASLRALGYGAHRAERAAGLFRRHDERQLREMAAFRMSHDAEEYRSEVTARQAMIEEALRRDMAGHSITTADDAWDTKSLEDEAKKRA